MHFIGVSGLRFFPLSVETLTLTLYPNTRNKKNIVVFVSVRGFYPGEAVIVPAFDRTPDHIYTIISDILKKFPIRLN